MDRNPFREAMAKLGPLTLDKLPDWWNKHGHEMAVKNSEKNGLVLSAKSAVLAITRNVMVPMEWNVDWEIHHINGARVDGRIIMTDEELKAAFGLANLSADFCHELVEVYGGDCGVAGKFIRWFDHLNIPCPGTGLDGDPNISVKLTDEIKDAVNKLAF